MPPPSFCTRPFNSSPATSPRPPLLASSQPWPTTHRHRPAAAVAAAAACRSCWASSRSPSTSTSTSSRRAAPPASSTPRRAAAAPARRAGRGPGAPAAGCCGGRETWREIVSRGIMIVGSQLLIFRSENEELLEIDFFFPLHIYLGSWQTINFEEKILETLGDGANRREDFFLLGREEF